MSAAERWSEQRLEHWTVKTLSESLTTVMQAFDLSGEAAKLSFEPAAAPPGVWQLWDSPVWLSLGGIADDGPVYMGCPGSTAVALAAFVMGGGEPAIEEGISTFAEVINQAFVAVGDEATKQLGRKIEISAGEAVDQPEGAISPVELRVTLDGGSHAITLAPTAAWVEAVLGPEESDEPEQPAAPAAGADQPEAAPPDAAAAAAGAETSLMIASPHNLERLLEVELDLAISFGETTLPLADVLKLSSGSIVELNRAISDSVDLLVNDSVIAKGEVVVVDGNYGIRVTEIASPKQRVETLF